MTKTQVQYNREHIARIRRKAKAFDKLSLELKTLAEDLPSAYGDHARKLVMQAIERAERQAGE